MENGQTTAGYLKNATHLVRAFVTPREDVRARISVESLGKPAHHALLDELAFLDRHGGEGAVEQAGGVCMSPPKNKPNETTNR